MHLTCFMSVRITFVWVVLAGEVSKDVEDVVAVSISTSTIVAIVFSCIFFAVSIISVANISDYSFIVRLFCSCSLEIFQASIAVIPTMVA